MVILWRLYGFFRQERMDFPEKSLWDVVRGSSMLQVRRSCRPWNLYQSCALTQVYLLLTLDHGVLRTRWLEFKISGSYVSFVHIVRLAQSHARLLFSHSLLDTVLVAPYSVFSAP